MAKTLESTILMGGKIDPSLEKAIQQASGDMEKLSAAALKANQKAEMAAMSTTLQGRQKSEKAQLKAQQSTQRALLQEALRNNKTLTAAQKSAALSDFDLDQKQAMIDLEGRHKIAASELRAEQEAQMAYYSQIADAADRATNASSWDATLKSAQKLGANLESLGATAKAAGKNIVTYIAAPLLALAGKSYSEFGEQESAFAGVRKTVEATEEEYVNLDKTVTEMTNRIPKSYVKLSGGMEIAGQLGVPIENLSNFTEIIAALDVSTNLGMEDAATMMAHFINVTGKGYGHVSNLGSAVVALGNNFATTERDIMEMSTRMASSSDLAGLSQTDILALSTALSSMGIEAEAGGSAAAKLMKTMQVTAETGRQAQGVIAKTGMSLRDLQMMQSMDGKGFKGLAFSMGYTSEEMSAFIDKAQKIEQFSSVLGLSSEEFAQSWKSNPAQTMLNFFSKLGQMDKSGMESAIVMLDEMGMTEIRLSNLVLSSTKNPEMLAKALSLAAEAYYQNSALFKESDQRYATQESQDIILANKASNAMANYGEAVAKALEPIKGKIGEIITKFGEMDTEAQNRLLNITMAITAGGGITMALGSIIEKIGSIVSFFGKSPSAAVAAVGMVGASALAVGTWWLVDMVKSASEAVTELQDKASKITIAFDEQSRNEMLSQIQEVQSAISDLNSEEASKARRYSASAKMGYGDQETFVKAVAYEREVLKQNRESITGIYAEQMAAAQERMAEAAIRGDTATADQEKALIEGLRAELPIALAEADAQYTKSMSSVVEGMLSQYDGVLEMLNKYGEYYKAASQIDQFNPDWMDEYQQADYLKRVFPESIQQEYLAGTDFESFDQMAAGQHIDDMLAAYRAMSYTAIRGMSEYMTPEDFSGIAALLSTIVEGEGMQYLDPKSLSGVLLDAFALMDYSRANKDMADAGYGDAMSYKLPEFLNSDVSNLMQSAATQQGTAATSLVGAADKSQAAATSLDAAGGRLISAAYSLENSQPTFKINFSVPGMATGGTVTGPTYALIGEGRDDETVIPHNDSPRSRSLLYDAAEGMGMSLGGGGQYVFSPQITINGNADESAVSSAIDDAFEQFKAWAAELEIDRGRTSFA